MVAKDYRELVVWEQAMVLTEKVYTLTRKLPAEERFGLVSQMRRAAVSVPSCIAEGNARASIPDYLRLVSMAAGSLAELRTQILLTRRLKLAPADEIASCDATATRVDLLLKRLQSGLRAAQRERAAKTSSRFPFPVSRP